MDQYLEVWWETRRGQVGDEVPERVDVDHLALQAARLRQVQWVEVRGGTAEVLESDAAGEMGGDRAEDVAAVEGGRRARAPVAPFGELDRQIDAAEALDSGYEQAVVGAHEDVTSA